MYSATPSPVRHASYHQMVLEFTALLEHATTTVDDDLLWRWVMVVQDWWRTDLLPIVEDEECRLLPRLAAQGHQQLSKRSLREHRELEALVYDSTLPCRERLSRLAKLLRRHVEFEISELESLIQA